MPAREIRTPLKKVVIVCIGFETTVTLSTYVPHRQRQRITGLS